MSGLPTNQELSVAARVLKPFYAAGSGFGAGLDAAVFEGVK